MSKWKYATLTQRERVKKIRDGNSDVYEEEMKRTNDLINVRNDFGLNTDEAVAYKSYITDTYKKATRPKEKRTVNRTADTPVYRNADMDAAFNNFYAAAVSFSNDYIVQKEQANAEAKTNRDELEEWVASNGYTRDGKVYKERSLEIQNELEEKLKKIKAAYDKNIEKTRQVLQRALLGM